MPRSGKRSRRETFSITEPITLDDLRWLVNQSTNLPADSHVDVREHKGMTQMDYDPASITVAGDVPE